MSPSPADTARWWNTERAARRRTLLDALIREHHVRRYGLFAVTTEGRLLPDGSESASGFVVDDEGNVYSFWLDWDERQQRIAFTDWEYVEPEADWEADEEYRQARQAAGLA